MITRAEQLLAASEDYVKGVGATKKFDTSSLQGQLFKRAHLLRNSLFLFEQDYADCAENPQYAHIVDLYSGLQSLIKELQAPNASSDGETRL